MPIAPPSHQPSAQLRFSVSDYHRMAEAGVFGPEARIELLDGHLYAMSPIGSQHAACVRRLNRLFAAETTPNEALISVQNPIALSPHSEPEPDLALLKPRDDDYAARHPRADEVLLVVEVADTTLTFDREVKVPLYAQAKIPLVWVVAPAEDQVYTYQKPSDGTYTIQSTCTRGDALPVPDEVVSSSIPVDRVLLT